MAYSYDRTARAKDWADLERLAKATLRKVSAMFARSSGGHWDWEEKKEGSLMVWEVDSPVVSTTRYYDLHPRHVTLPDIPEFSIDTELGRYTFPVVVGVGEWDKFQASSIPSQWQYRSSLIDITGDFDPKSPLPPEKYEEGVQILQHLERNVVPKALRRIEVYLDDVLETLDEELSRVDRKFTQDPD